MKTFQTKEKTSFSTSDDLEVLSEEDTSFFNILFFSFFKSTRTIVDFEQYDNMKVIIIDNKYREEELHSLNEDQSHNKSHIDKKSKKKRRSRFLFFKRHK